MKNVIKVLKIGVFLTGAALAILHFVPGSGFVKIWSYLATMVLPFTIDIFRLIGLKVSKRFEIAFLLFVIPSMVMGIDFDVYKIFYPFDKIAHTFSGVLAAFGAKEILDQASGKPDAVWFQMLFVFAFVCMTAAVWECFEFSCDQIAGTHMQELIAGGVEDTMYDMIVAMIGGVVGIVACFGGRLRRR